ncbi:MAG TPA: tRNA uridine-5-carboxymethylaminomethyl(34) synthesis GTPase MnmE [Pyrinomonadaceae bacterium]|nr:tRNA uridine-5-carboxymethylaminomethyl(34) synthesis GTPase MnmE [Pyrinomonadaceae bacterium]
MQAAGTIVALSTPPGRSGIGVIRISGERALDLTRALVRDPDFSPQPNCVVLKAIFDPDTLEVVDRVIVTFFKSPHSYTGEDVVELSCHGSPPLLLRVLDSLLLLGARAADPGEFTMRAVANGRINLTQAEAVRDLIDAQTYAAVNQAARQLGGELSKRLQPIKDALLEIIVPLESSLEFVEDDLPDDIAHNIKEKLSVLSAKINDMADSFRRGRLLKDGLRVALIGRPNVGKSSLFNRLLSSDRAIVTEIPGTTRDTISEIINIEGIPVLITDTAGVRSSSDRIEQLGIERTRRAIADADLIIAVLDGSQALVDEDEEIIRDASRNRYVVALNKSDLESFCSNNAQQIDDNLSLVPVSAKTGHGLDALCAEIIKPFTAEHLDESSFVITNARHYDLLRRTSESLQAAQGLLQENVSEELILANLYESLRFLGEITGETTPEDILSQIFLTFCIGK